ncbi:MAG: hypothetical protein RSB67_02040 [Clostridia bacterium]
MKIDKFGNLKYLQKEIFENECEIRILKDSVNVKIVRVEKGINLIAYGKARTINKALFDTEMMLRKKIGTFKKNNNKYTSSLDDIISDGNKITIKKDKEGIKGCMQIYSKNTAKYDETYIFIAKSINEVFCKLEEMADTFILNK